jgi:hypothetical protein
MSIAPVFKKLPTPDKIVKVRNGLLLILIRGANTPHNSFIVPSGKIALFVYGASVEAYMFDEEIKKVNKLEKIKSNIKVFLCSLKLKYCFMTNPFSFLLPISICTDRAAQLHCFLSRVSCLF